MKLKLALIAVLATAVSPAFAGGDIAKGEAGFKQCQTCHVVADETGKVLAGKAGKIGPNLYGIVGRQAGSYPDFKYGESIVAGGVAGLMWDEVTLTAYLQDPTAFWKERLADKGAKSKMAFKVKNAEAAADVIAYLTQFGPAVPAAAATTSP